MTISLARQRRGDFNHQAVLSAVEIDFADMLPTFRYHHLIQDGTYLYGGFADEAGRRYTVLRKISGELSAGLVLNASDGQNLASHPRASDSMRGGTLRYQADDSGFRIRPSSVKGSLGEPFGLEMTRDLTVWDEGDLMHVAGRIVGDCGLQWYDPCRDGGDLYVSHILRAGGTLLGQPVEGFFAVDQQHLLPGTVWRQTPYFQRLEVAWFTMGVEYDDGTIEVGQLCHGGDDWGFAMMANQHGPFTLTRDIAGKPTFGADEFPTRVDFVIDGQDWVWQAHADGVMPGYAADPHYRPADGWCTRANEKRSVVASFGWIDAFNDGRS